MKYIVMAYLLGIGFIIGMTAGAICKDTKGTLFGTPLETVLFVLVSPVVAILCGLYIFFNGKGE